MSEFEAQLHRLKAKLGLREDQEVAKALGMTKASFSDRKRRGSFPEKRVMGLKALYPELDVQYILFGEFSGAVNPQDLQEFLKSSHELGVSATSVLNAMAAGIRNARSSRVLALDHPLLRSLVECLNWCDDEAIELIVRVAARFRSDSNVPLGGRPAAVAVRAAEIGSAVPAVESPAIPSSSKVSAAKVGAAPIEGSVEKGLPRTKRTSSPKRR